MITYKVKRSMKLKKLSAALLALLICTQPVKAQEINRTEPVTVQNYTETVRVWKDYNTSLQKRKRPAGYIRKKATGTEGLTAPG